MVERPTPHYPLSVEDYLELEESATVKHEYVGGEIHAMVGASRRHNRISLNIARKLADMAEGGSCRGYVSDLKFRSRRYSIIPT